MSTSADRLRVALERAGMNAFSLSNALKGLGAKGTSYTSIRLALEGQRPTAIAMLRSAAPILGVREEWLVLGTGPMEAQESFDDAYLVSIEVAVESALPEFAHMSPNVRHALFEAAELWGEALVPYFRREQFPDVCAALWGFVEWPAHVFGRVEAERWRELNRRDGWTGYAVPMLFAMRLGVRLDVMSDTERANLGLVTELAGEEVEVDSGWAASLAAVRRWRQDEGLKAMAREDAISDAIADADRLLAKAKRQSIKAKAGSKAQAKGSR